jgi:hypothetical protein
MSQNREGEEEIERKKKKKKKKKMVKLKQTRADLHTVILQPMSKIAT